jgi:Molybdopterin-binding domain of aldehyde dehydrogenase
VAALHRPLNIGVNTKTIDEDIDQPRYSEALTAWPDVRTYGPKVSRSHAQRRRHALLDGNELDIGPGLINPRLARSQIFGGMICGMSFGLHEEAVIDRRSGRILNANRRATAGEADDRRARPPCERARHQGRW